MRPKTRNPPASSSGGGRELKNLGVQLMSTRPQKRHDKDNNNTLPSSGHRIPALPVKYLAARARYAIQKFDRIVSENRLETHDGSTFLSVKGRRSKSKLLGRIAVNPGIFDQNLMASMSAHPAEKSSETTIPAL